MKKITKELLALDSRDQRILAELFRDGRAHYSTIAKNTQISKDTVSYRIDKLIEAGVMTNISTIIDIRKLDWSSSLILLKLRNLGKTKIRKFIKYLVRNPFVVEILELVGAWDYAIRFYHKDAAHLNQLASEVETEFAELFDHYSTFFISENILLPYNALFEKYAVTLPMCKPLIQKIDALDLRILSAISTDGRKSLAQLQVELKENRMTIYNRINNMRKANIIQGFRPNLFTEKLGFHWYVIGLKLRGRSEAKIKTIVNRLKSILLVHFIMTGFGSEDIIFYIQVKTVQELQQIMYILREEFSKDIKSVDSANTIKDYKWDFFPEGLLEAMK